MQSIYNRLVILSIVFLVILSGIGYYSYLQIQESQLMLAEKTAYLTAKSFKQKNYGILSLAFENLSDVKKDSLQQILKNNLKENNRIISIDFINSEGTIVFSSITQNINKKLLIPSTQGNFGNYQFNLDSINKNTISIFLPQQDLEINEYYSMYFLFDLRKFKSALGNLPLYFLAILLSFGVLFIIAIYFVSRAYDVPFKSLNKALNKLNAEDYSFRVQYERQDEFSNTFENLNRAIEKVSFLKDGYKKAEKRITSLLQAVNESIIILDSKREIVSINDAAINMFQVNEEKNPKWFSQLLSTNLELNRTISQALKKRTHIVEKKMSVFLTDENEIYVNLNVESLGEEGIIQGVILTFKDLRLISELENNLLRSMKFGVITNLASSISHEIKNPLSAMAMHSEIIKNKVANLEFDDKNKLNKSLETLESEVKRLNRIIQQFLSLARPSRLDLDLININKLVEDVLSLVQQQAQELHIKISINLQMKLDTIYGEEDQLKQVLLNLILNAFAAMESGGELLINTKGEHRKFYIEINDSGSGIPENIQSKIFDLYFTTKSDGGGIGLSICKNIMEAHEGKLYFETSTDSGTTFIMEFPAKEQTTLYSTRAKNPRKI